MKGNRMNRNERGRIVPAAVLLMRSVLVRAVLLCAVLFGAAKMLHGGPVYASVRDTAPILQLKKVAELPVPGAGWYLEGGTATGSGYAVSFWKSTPALNLVTLLDPDKNWSAVKTKEADLSHSNDMCYVRKNKGEIYVALMDQNRKEKIAVLDASTLEKTGGYSLPRTYHAIGYDGEQDRFAAVYEEGSGVSRKLVCDILNRDLSCTGSFPVSTNLTYQGLAVHNSLIYYTCWERGGTSIYEPVCDGVFRKDENVIYVYDFAGNPVKTLLITPPAGYSKFELETASFLKEKMILQFNVTLDDAAKTRKVEIYEVIGEGPSFEQQAQKAAADQFPGIRTRITGVVRKKRAVSLTWDPVTFNGKPVEGYQIQICRKKTFNGISRRDCFVSRKDPDRLLIRRLKRRTVYYVRVRAFHTYKGVRIYSGWSQRRKVRTR